MTFDKDFDELLDKFVEDYLNKQENEFEPTHEADPSWNHLLRKSIIHSITYKSQD